MLEGGATSGGEIEADASSWPPLAKLADYFPFSQRVRERLTQSDPPRSIHNLKATWTGEREKSSISTCAAISASSPRMPTRKIPGLPADRRFEASEKGGASCSDRSASRSSSPESWLTERAARHARGADRLEIRAGSLGSRLQQSLVRQQRRRGTLFAPSRGCRTRRARSISPAISPAPTDAPYIATSLVPQPVVDYLKASIRAGHSNDVRLRAQGSAAKFPFDDPATGIFQVVAKVTDADFRYAESWPQRAGCRAI